MHKNRPEENPPAPDRPQCCAAEQLVGEVTFILCKIRAFLSSHPEAVIIHSHKRIFFVRAMTLPSFPQSSQQAEASHDEEEPKEMRVIHRAILAADQQRLFFLVEGRFLLKETIVNATSMCAEIADNRHAVHILPQNFRAAIHGKPELMGNCFFERTFGNGIQERNVGDCQQINVGQSGISWCRSLMKCFK